MSNKTTELTIDDKKEFCQEYINSLPQEGREEVFDILRLYVDDALIDSTNSDGSRVYWHNISDEAFQKIYKVINDWLQN